MNTNKTFDSAVIKMKEIYQSVTIDIIAKCVFGIELNSVEPSTLNKSNRFYSSAINTFSAGAMTNRWISYFWLLFFNIFPEALPASVVLPGKVFDCKYKFLFI